jgi:acetolactate synthase-1/2/3 large subunit
MACLHLCGTPREIFLKVNEILATHLASEKLSTITAPIKVQNPCLPATITVRHAEHCQNPVEPIKPQRLLCELMQRLPAETRYYIDNSNSVPWSIHYLFSAYLGAYRPSLGFAPMGWAIGAAIGTAFANRTIPVVCLTGDGCFLMSGSEITVAVAESLPIIFIVMNDRAYGMIKHSHRLIGSEVVSYEIPSVDFCELAQSLGANAYRIQQIDDFSQIDFSTLLKSNKPTLLEVFIDVEERPPLGMF